MSNIIQSDISKIARGKYLDYALSVIVGRALPDIRDGLKPVHRRIIHDMNELKIYPNVPYRKSARVVGDVLGKYHPHGDSSVYDAITRLAQDFSVRYPLIDGHGNWGSVDGDSAGAMRYTEMRMSKITLELLKDIYKDTVDFTPNFDGEEQEPTVLPCRFPNLLVNGSEGIAVGVATAIPPHNLSDAIDTAIYQIDNPDCNIEDLVKILKAPDMPTGGQILNPNDMVKVYTEGQGKIIMRAKYHLEIEDERNNIIITEIPYQVNKSKLLETLFYLTNNHKKIEKGKEVGIIEAEIKGVAEIVDESDREGMRINIKLKKNVDVNKILALLFKKSNLQCNYNANFTAVYHKDNKVRLLEHFSLKEMLTFYINHQKEVVLRRTNFDLNKAKDRIHIIEGLKKAILNIDKTIHIIKTSTSKEEVFTRLNNELKLDEQQSTAILDMRLQRLTGLEVEKLNKEYAELSQSIVSLTKIINDENELKRTLISELIEIKNKYKDERKTELIYDDTVQSVTNEDLIEDFNCKIIYTKQQYIKKFLKSSDSQLIKKDDVIIEELPSTNKSTLMLFTNHANRYKIPCYELEEKKPSQLGLFIPNLIDLEKGEEVIGVISVDENNPKGYIVSVYENGKISKVDLNSFISNNKKLQNCYSKESKLVAIKYIEKDCDILMISKEGKGIIVSTNKISAKGSRNSQGNQAMKVSYIEGNKVVSSIINPNQNLNFTMSTLKGKTKDYYLDDIAPTGKPNEERTFYSYLTSNVGNKGNYIFNNKNDVITDIIYN